ncbi:hypothetical protein KV134_08450 [Tetragenococcus halophilus]|uniref:hypothetical protein n=1 Tax=Tetragenococcus halophilus TaxID=51669 RepID=UPI000CAE053C|nr:hypothetical protein [Tetragenococcus halophilus]MCO7027036.1 hypothetical protein [Tetragenococcus halophilus]NWO00914.1 hypothetical protein [Tetragenococcus halophilus]QXN86240.1 hypothetical protein KV134_08450 [Tetragenococcus halophilus]RQD29183.1 hypothetical protein C7K42_09835 [Tetragenococcus halophilus subsp. halophilus DSM 20339]WJS81326.1 hypothetical protein KFZ55_08565 [Tetragenococcus halophilus]
MKKIYTSSELLTAVKQNQSSTLELQNSMTFDSSIILPEGMQLIGTSEATIFLSFTHSDGFALTGNNTLSNLIIQTVPTNRAIFIQSIQKDLGEITLNRLTVTGQIQLITRENTLKAKIIAENVDIVASDSRKFSEQPHKYGANVYQGALTIYNYNSHPDSKIEANLEDISVGRAGAPVIGSGIFIAGFNEEGGSVLVNRLTTKAVYTNGMIPQGQPNLITGAIFILTGAKAKQIVSQENIVTYGTNDMVLDVWGVVIDWLVKAPILSYGPNGIGFVNFGIVHNFKAKDKIETFGLGARGFNQYDGTIENATFHSIMTHGNGSIGIQISRAIGKITVENSVETYGTLGETLVKGVLVDLAADGINIQEGGRIKQLHVDNNIVTNGDTVSSYHIDGDMVETFTIDGEIVANGKDSTPMIVENNGYSPTKDI